MSLLPKDVELVPKIWYFKFWYLNVEIRFRIHKSYLGFVLFCLFLNAYISAYVSGWLSSCMHIGKHLEVKTTWKLCSLSTCASWGIKLWTGFPP